MRDPDDRHVCNWHGRYWLSRDNGDFTVIAQLEESPPSSDLLEPSDYFYIVRQIQSCKITCTGVVEAYGSPQGRADLDARTQREEGYVPPPVQYVVVKKTLMIKYKPLQDREGIDYKFAGHPDDPLSGARLRGQLAATVWAFLLNITTYYRRLTHRYSKLVSSTLIWTSLALGGLYIYSSIKDAPFAEIAALVLGVALLILLGVFVVTFNDGKHRDERLTTAFLTATEKNTNKNAHDMAMEASDTQTLSNDLLEYAKQCPDVARVEGRLSEGARDLGGLRKIARWLSRKNEAHIEYNHINQHLIAHIHRGIQSKALCEAFYIDLGEHACISKRWIRHLTLSVLALAAILPAITVWQSGQPVFAFGVDLGLYWLLIVHNGFRLLACDKRLDMGLPREWDGITGGGEPSGPPPTKLYEDKMYDVDFSEAIRTIAYEEKRRQMPPSA